MRNFGCGARACGTTRARPARPGGSSSYGGSEVVQLQASVKRVSGLPQNMNVQSWPHATAPVLQDFCWATTPLQFQSYEPHASGIVRNCVLSNPGLAPESRSQQSPVYADRKSVVEGKR